MINNSKQVDNDTNYTNWDSILDVYEEYKKPEIKSVVEPITSEPIKTNTKKKKKKKNIIINKSYDYDEYDNYYDKYDDY
jgi:hypothetical protein